MAELTFTGERVVPGEVPADLWSEHIARYAFARRYVTGRRVLDAGCGTGYGSAELAQDAAIITGVDISAEAAQYARTTYPIPNLRFVGGSCAQMPFSSGAFDVVVAFEIIEHLSDYRGFIDECSRVLTGDGLLIVSTPNKSYYGDSRAGAGPNPYHSHEFEAVEFHDELTRVFPNVSFLVQNRVECFAFHPIKTFWPAQARVDAGGGSAADAHFFVAVCSRGKLPQQRSFVYVPRAANLLKEREQHVALLQGQLERTQNWLQETQRERDELLAICRRQIEEYEKQKHELEEHNRWAERLNTELAEAYRRIEQVQTELTAEQRAAAEMAASYEAKVVELDAENIAKTKWALETEERLTCELQSRTAELAECVRLLTTAETTVEERTLWAQRIEAQRQALETQLHAVQASRWLKLGRRLGLGPAITFENGRQG